MLDTKTMITKEYILESLKNPILGDKHKAILKLALKGLESEDLMSEQRITVNNLNNTVGILNKNRDFWRKKHNDLTDELDGKITALEEESKAKDKKIAEVTRFLNQSQSKYDSLVGQASNEIKKLQDQLKAKDADLAKAPKIINDALTVQILQAQLTESMASHHASVDDANLLIFTLSKERDALAEEIKKWEEADRAKNADIDKLLTENQNLKDSREKLIASVIGMK